MKRAAARLAGVAAGTLIALAIAGQRHGEQGHRLLDERQGAIACVEIQFAPGAQELTRCLESFFRQIPGGVEVVAACASDAECSTFRELAKSWGINQLSTVNVGRPITGWSKDRFLVAEGNPATLLQPRAKAASLQARANDEAVAPAIARALPKHFRAQELPLVFDSGDIVASDGLLYVSDVLWEKNRRSKLGEDTGFRSKADLAAYLGRTFRSKVVWLYPAPPHHIGMFVAPLGDGTVAVGDPDLGRRLWTKEKLPGVGEPDFSDAAGEPFRKVAEQLRASGQRVVRLPLMYFAPQVYLTYTNGVFETRAGKRIAYMPWYGIPRLDDYARHAYEEAGWEVRTVNVREVFQNRGTIGCLVNVLQRD